MKNIQLLNKIAKVGTDRLDSAVYNVGTDVTAPEGIMVRSAKMHDMTFNPELLAIARAGAGVNNIPVDRCATEGIVVFNTPGANANGVKELAICALLLASRKVVDGIAWAKSLAGTADVAKQVEAGKSQFAGTEIQGKTLGVIGLGAIGGMVANTAIALGMKVVGCDPYLSVEGAWNLDHHIKHANTYEEVYAASDYITLHVPATPTTTNMINAETIAQMKDGVKIINLARAELVNAADLAAAMEAGKVGAYVTDFPTEATVAIPGALTIPHLGASTEESEDNCAVMAAEELDEYLRTGNIRNSVNYPAASMPASGAMRVCVLHANVPAVLTNVTNACSKRGLNIENMLNKSKGENAYTMLDLSTPAGEDLLADLATIGGVRRARLIAL
ncbi:MAG: 3-phosphoglycerate dehydrogenase [Clostridia bacterium]|nr:3-phosphoglycerate dehydrogenase [Clostridia bacterium]